MSIIILIPVCCLMWLLCSGFTAALLSANADYGNEKFNFLQRLMIVVGPLGIFLILFFILFLGIIMIPWFIINAIPWLITGEPLWETEKIEKVLFFWCK